MVFAKNCRDVFKNGNNDMKIDAEVSLYPLRSANLSKPISCFLEGLQNKAVKVEPGSMSSLITGECSDVFRAMADAFEKGAEEGDVVLVMKVSNACG
jgi:uncharacterized protein YqgV (UPF0045/DUF77 family)